MIATQKDILGPSQHADIALTLARALETLDCNSNQIFLNHGVDKSQLCAPESRISLNSLQSIWRESVETSNNDALGIVFAEHVHLAGFHGLCFSCAISNDLYDAFTRLARFFRVVSSLGRIVLKGHQDEFRLCLKLPVSLGVAVNESSDGVIAMLVRICRFMKGDSFDLVRLELQRPQPNELDYFRQYFRCPIRFGADENVLVFSKKMMAQALPAANPELVRVLDQAMIEYLRRFDEANITSRVSSFIIDTLPKGIPKQKDIAELMYQSTRSLKRNLEAQGVTYMELLERVQRILSTRYLKETKHSIGEISYLVGYSEPSNFTRSFKKWTGQTPQEYRESHSKK